MNTITLTADDIEACATKNDGYSFKTIRLLTRNRGLVDGKPIKGWKSRAIGTTITEAEYNEAFNARTKNAKQEERNRLQQLFTLSC